jgi:hypothetical protein
VTNEFLATGGRDNENDDDFRLRIKQHPNIKAQKTIPYLTTVFQLENSDVLLLRNLGYDSDGLLNIMVLLQNGVDLTISELSNLLDSVEGYFSLSDLNKDGDTIGIKLVNPTWSELEIELRADIRTNFDSDQLRKNMQIEMSRYLDIRNWFNGKIVEWDDLLQIAKETDGVKYVPDTFFTLNGITSDLTPVDNTFPRIKRFVLYDLDGNLISDSNSVLSPIFYPNV